MERNFSGVWDLMVDAKAVSSLLFACRNWFREYHSTTWNMVPSCLMWLVWYKRNTCTFEDKEIPLDLFKSLLFGNWGFTQCLSIPYFLNSVRFSP